ncbi:uncharacterized protein DUF4184 [Acinetobacter calcoaceticus]|uniref:Uncharacterized protein DUF4184 n=1 Tax=Acinetobacter calcoaceticus TaxID=471 RepID=A0A4R1XWL8_ACICA|nr:uncharacterized protein DUF4184 [Acinetobacter calcoaceticus]
MPFTLSHMIVAPPISKLSGDRLPIAALAIGSMTPDLYRLFTEQDFNQSHQWNSLFSLNLGLGLFFCALWYLLYRPVLFALLNLNKPLRLHSFRSICGFVLCVCIAIVIGAATHLIWDGLTHSDFRSFAFHDFLNQSVVIAERTFAMHRVLQIGSSIIALPILLWMGIHYAIAYRPASHQHQAHTAQTEQSDQLRQPLKFAGLLLILFSFFIGCFAYIDFAQSWSADARWADLYQFIGRAINQFSSAFLISFSLGCVAILIFMQRKGLQPYR